MSAKPPAPSSWPPVCSNLSPIPITEALLTVTCSSAGCQCGDPVPVRHFDSKRKRAGLRRIALESGGLSTWRNEAGPAPHFVVAGVTMTWKCLLSVPQSWELVLNVKGNLHQTEVCRSQEEILSRNRNRGKPGCLGVDGLRSRTRPIACKRFRRFRAILRLGYSRSMHASRVRLEFENAPPTIGFSRVPRRGAVSISPSQGLHQGALFDRSAGAEPYVPEPSVGEISQFGSACDDRCNPSRRYTPPKACP